jgi:hydroxymethylpyrimidine/phosphomethylpyrimidine kinase
VIKIGMLGTAEMVETVARALDSYAAGVPLVVDPVMVAKGGHPLLADEAVGAVRRLLVPRATVLTPNAPEAARLVGFDVADVAAQRRAAAALLAMGAKAVLAKGGHLPGPEVTDLLIDADGENAFTDPRIDTTATHGTGCTLASALACGLAQGLNPVASLLRARHYLRQAILYAPGLGQGHGPIDHGWTLRRANEG